MATHPMPGSDDLRNVVPLRRPGQAPRLFHDAPTGDLAVPDANGADVLEGEILDGHPDDYEPRTAVELVRDIIERPGVQTAARHAAFVALGSGVTVRRLWEARSTSRYQRMMRGAESVGDHTTALEWESRESLFRRDRHQRRMDWIEVPARTLAVLPQAAVATVVGMGVFGGLLALATRDVTKVAAPWLWAAEVVEFTVTAVSVAWLPALAVSPLVLLAILWVVGKRHAENSDIDWLATAAEADLDIEIDENVINRALEALRIQQITAHFKQGLPLQYLVTARRDGRGTHAVLRLPAGVTAEQISRKRDALATGLYRAAKEVWPSTGSEAGILDLWVADKGALAEGAGPYPLLDEGLVDAFKGVPFGKTLRGTPVLAPIRSRNTITGGMPGQGKSSAARVIMAGVALDPTAELRIWVPDTNFDFEVFTPRCSRYVMGAEDEKVAQILEDLRELHEEVQARGELLVRYQEPEVTRALADKNIGLHPLVCLLEEAHIAIQHKQYGEEISELLISIVKLGRKRGIHLIVSTQAPTSSSMPRDVTRNCSNGIAFAVGDHVANDALLGQGAHSAGHRATELIPGVDKGTALVKGFSGERSEMVQAYFLSVAKGNDQVTPLIQRALKEIERRGMAVPGTNRARPEVEQARDLLEDLDEVMGAERIKLSDLVSLLRDRAPRWRPYQSLTAKSLKKLLDAEGVKVANTGNVLRLDPAELRAVIAQRATEDLDTWE